MAFDQATTVFEKSWLWSNPKHPAKELQIENDGSSIRMLTSPNSDFWRRTHYDFIRDDGNFLRVDNPTLNIASNLILQVSFKGKYEKLYDQAGTMLRSGEGTWIKTGIEYVDQVKFASAVVTREFSDWSTNPLSSLDNNDWFTIRVELLKGDVKVEYALGENPSNFHLLRIAHLFDTMDENAENGLQVGLFAASPQNNDGFEAVFKSFSLTILNDKE